MYKTGQYLCTLLATLTLISLHATPAWAQFDNIENFIRAGAEDAETLTRAYLAPLPSGLGGSLNSGWHNSASTHNTLGFDIQIRAAAALIPDTDQRFNINELDLNNIQLASGESATTPTIGGSNNDGPEVIVSDNDGDEVGRFNLPQGTGYHFVPAPMVQASVGLIKNTDVIVRFVPEVALGDYGNFNMKGVGIKHEVSQWLPGGALLPVDISLMAGFNRIDLDANLNLEPNQPDPGTDYDNQKVTSSIETFTVKVLVGKDLPFVSLYGGVGYETSTLNLDVTGNYPITVEEAGIEQTETITDPFSYSEDGTNDISLTGGLKFNVLFFNIFGEYTLAKYPVANAGIGFSFR